MARRANRVAKGRSSARMEMLRQDAVRTLQEMEEAIVATRNQLKLTETFMRRMRRMVESGHSASEIARLNGAAEARAATSENIREVQAARHRVQQAQFKLASAEGSSMADIARGWGVSRQLVSRMVKEPTRRRRRP